MVLLGTFPPDIRVKREAKYLTKNGHNVILVINGPPDKPKQEVIDGIKICRTKNPSSKAYNKINNVFSYLTFIYPRIYQTVISVFKKRDIDVFHAHDLPVLRTVSVAGSRTDTPVVADLHEIYPKSLKAWRKEHSLAQKLHPRALFRPPIRYSLLERQLLPRVDGVVTVSELAQEYYIEKYGLTPERTEVVRNVIDLERFDSYSTETLNIDGDFIISYIGNFTPERNLEPLIKSMGEITEKIPTAKLIMVGDSTGNYIESLKRQAERLGVSQNVIFTGWVEFERVPSYFEASDLTVSAVAHSGVGSEIALPNKLFQAMATSTPLIVNNTQSTANIVSETGCGVIINPYTDKNITSTVLDLYENDSRIKKMGQLGRKSVENRYNISEEIDCLENIYEKVTS